MSLGIVEMLTRIGDERIQFQNLDQCWTDAKYNLKAGTKITFGTEASIAGRPGGDRQIGLVLWLPRELVKEILDGAGAPTEGGS